MVETKSKKKNKKNIPSGVAHIKASFNNTIINISDSNGETIVWTSGGSVGFKGSRKSTPYAAQVAAEEAVRRATEFGVHKLDIIISGTGAGRETAVRTLQNMGMDVGTIKDITPTPHNGCRPKKAQERIMARYTGPRVRISRRIGFNVFENKKGDKAPPRQTLSTLEKMAGKRVRETDYGTQLKEKQKVRIYVWNFRKTISKLLQRSFSNVRYHRRKLISTFGVKIR
jgi:small subunit ribosomal protein S11